MKDQIQNIVGILRRRRLDLGYSQDYMADKMNIGQNCYSKIELAKSELTLDRLITICEILELPIDELLAEQWDKLPVKPSKPMHRSA